MSQPAPITVRLFSVLRERIGTDVITLEASSVTRVDEVLRLLGERHPEILRYERWIRVAVNREYVTGDRSVVPGDEIALITPVSGG